MDACSLLFIGVDWLRKGGDLAVAVTKQLNERGLNATLTIVGCEPMLSGPLPTYVHYAGFLSKTRKEDVSKIENFLATSHFLIVPSVAESFGAVFCEASSFGTPSISRRVGGIPTAVRDGINGQLFSQDADASDYCDYIINHFNNHDTYRALAMSSFEEYNSRLNWDHTARKLIEIFRRVEK